MPDYRPRFWDDVMGQQPQSGNQQRSGSREGSDERLRQRLNDIDAKIKRNEERLKGSVIARGVSAIGDNLPILQSTRETLQDERDGILTDMQDVERSRDQIQQSGGYGEGGLGAAFKRGLGNAQSTVGALGAMVGDVDRGDIENIVAGRERTMGAARNQEEQAAYERFQSADGFWASAREIFTDPILMANIAVESLPSSAASLIGGAVGAVGGAAAGSLAGPGGTVVGGRVGGGLGSGIGSFATEYGNAMLETFTSNNINIDDPDALEAAINDPQIMAEARERGLRRGLAVGAFDALSAGLAGKLGGGRVAGAIIGEGEATLARRAAGTAAGGIAETGSQGALGSAGEAAGQLAADGSITSPQDIVAEFAGEIPGGAIESTIGTAAEVARRPQQQPIVGDNLRGAIDTMRGGEVAPSGPFTLPSPERFDLDSADAETPMKVRGLNLTARQILESAQQNSSDPRIANILGQPVDANTKAQQVARIFNEEDARRIEPDVISRIAPLIGGKTGVSQTRAAIQSELAKLGDEIVDASQTLSQIRDVVSGTGGGRQFVGTLRGIVDGYRPTAPNGQTLVARPYMKTQEAEGGGREIVEDGSVIMTPDQLPDEMSRIRGAEEALINLAPRRQERFEQATATGTQREDLRPGAPEPEQQFFLDPKQYGEVLGGTAATIVEMENGKVRIQYDSPTETDASGAPVTISEEVSPLDLVGRVVRGTSRMTQELAADVRRPKKGVGTTMNPRQSVDRTSTRAVAETQQPGTLEKINPLEMTGIFSNNDTREVATQQPQQNAQQAPADQAAPRVEGTEQIAPPVEQPRLPAPPKGLPAPTQRRRPPPPVQEQQDVAEEDIAEEDMLDVEDHPRMVEHNEKYDAALERVQEAENATEVRKLAKRMIKEGILDEDAYADIDERMKDVPTAERYDEGMAALEEAIDTQRDNVGYDVADEIRSEDPRYYSARPEREETGTKPEEKTADLPERDANREAAQKIIDTFVEKLKARGKDGRVAANRFTEAMKDRRLSNDQVFAAAKTMEVVSRMGLKGADVQLVSALFDEKGEAVQGYYDATDTSSPGFVGVIKLSLDPKWTNIMTETAAHEAFHGLQKLLALHDQKTYRALMSAFNQPMTLDQIPESIKRVLQRTKYDGQTTFWETMQADPVFRDDNGNLLTWSGKKGRQSVLELQSYVMGYLHDAIKGGAEIKTLANTFRKAMEFWNELTTKVGSALKGNGFNSPKSIFIDAIEGKLADRLGNVTAEGTEGDVQFSAREKKPAFVAPKIGKLDIQPPLRESSLIPFLYDDGDLATLPTGRLTVNQAADFLQKRTRAALRERFGVDRITGPSPEFNEYVAQTLAAEGLAAIKKEELTGERSALDWYTSAIEASIKEAGAIYPMLSSDKEARRATNFVSIKTKKEARHLFTTAESITSQNMKVRDNARATEEQMDYFLENGRFDPSRSYGEKAPSISANLALANRLILQVFEGNLAEYGKFMEKEFTVGELNLIGKELGKQIGLRGPLFKVTGELVNETVYGSAVYGPKIGNGFWQNLNKNFSPVTIDLWFMRLWGRITGTLVNNETALRKQASNLRDAVAADAHPSSKVPDGYAERVDGASDEELIDIGAELLKQWNRQYKALRDSGMTAKQVKDQKLKPDWAFASARLAGQLKPNDAPKGGSQRKWIRSVVQRTLEILKDAGYNLTAADLQALVWYPEKDVYSLLKTKRLEGNLNVSYDTAFKEIADRRNGNAEVSQSNGRVRQGDDATRTVSAERGGDRERPADLGRGAQEGDGVDGDRASEARQYSARPAKPFSEAQRDLAAELRTLSSPRVGGRPDGTGNVTRKGGGVLAPNLKGKVPVAATYSHDPAYSAVLEKYGADAPDFHELTRGKAGARFYHGLISDAKNSDRFGAAVYVYDEADYADMRLFITKDGLSGFALKGDDIVSVFKHPKATDRLVAYSLVRMAIANGGRRLDAFDTVLPNIYSVNGMRASARMQWNDEYAPDGWNKNEFIEFNNGEPDVVFMHYDPSRTDLYEPGEGDYTEDYDTAVQMQVDGVQSKSNVQYSARAERTSTPEFQRWFKDSKAVDADGNPAIFFHGSGKNIKKFGKAKSGNNGLGDGPFYFTDDAGFAADYADSDLSAGGRGKTRKSGGNITPVYLSVQNPFDFDNDEHVSRVTSKLGTLIANTREDTFELISQGSWRTMERSTVQQAIRDLGFDGFYLWEGGVKNLAVYKPSQIKSINNSGAFNPSDDRILNSARRVNMRTLSQQAGNTPLRPAPRFTSTNPNFGGTEPGEFDKIVYQLQDKLIDVKRLQKNIEDTGNVIDDDANVYRAEELYHGRAAKRAKDFVDRELNPLLSDMKAKGVTLEQMDKFLHARHAKERNAQIRKINPNMQGNGSGMTDAEADTYINSLPNARRQQLERLANRVDAITQNTQQMLVEYGLETQDTINQWNATYKFYAPLRREGFEEEGLGAGQGMSIKGSSSKRAMGSDLGVVDVLANIAMQRERAISRGERNRVGNALMTLALQNPNDSFWFVVDPNSKDFESAVDKLVDFGIDQVVAEEIVGKPVERYTDKRSGRVVVRPNNQIGTLNNVIATRINGEDRYIILNERNPRAKRMATSLKNLDVAQAVYGLQTMAKATRYLSAINTQYNPAFGLFNLMRDLQGAAINLSDTPLAGKQKQVIGQALPAVMGMYRDLRAERGGGTATTNWAQLAEEFELEGGKTGYRDIFASSEDRAKEMEIELTGGSKVRQVATKVGGPVFNWLSDFNEAIENGVRLSAYKAARDMGLSKNKAASIAKNLTVNFNRKGAAANSVGALYGFFNAAVQGTARIGQSLAGPAGKKIVAGGLLLGIAQAVALAAAGIDDDVPEWMKDKNLIIPLSDGKYFAMPMPLGYHAIPAFSRRAVEFMQSGGEKSGAQLVDLMGMLADAFNPIGNAGLSPQTVLPSVFDPISALAENKDFAGRAISTEDFNTLDPTPGFERNRSGVSAVGDAIARAIDTFSGGNGYVPGSISPTGDQIDYLIGQATGGAGRLVLNTMATAKAVATGEDLPNYKIPVIGRMLGDVNEAAAVSQRFYDGIKEMNGHKRTVEGMDEKGEDANAYFEENPEAEFYEDAQDYENQVSKLRRERKAMIEEGADQEDVNAVTEEMQMLMVEFNQTVASYKAK